MKLTVLAIMFAITTVISKVRESKPGQPAPETGENFKVAGYTF